MEDYGMQLDEEGLRITRVIRQNAQKMGKLIDELLNFSRLGRSDMVTVQIDMQEMAKNCFEELVPVDKRQHIGFTLGDLHPVSGDAGMIRQVWLNLFSNALKFSSNRSNPLITVGSRKEDHKVIFTVQDNGAGFDMKYAEKLFGVFHRLHGNNEFEGTGVGLAIVHRIVTRHGGDVWAEGQVNNGASFSFSIPV
jgi:light-regulated signal transduction histidine kinase (bacteriophytochrome)